MEIPVTLADWVELGLFGLFCLVSLMQLWYYLFRFTGLAMYRQPQKPSSLPPLSVLICARNEAENLRKNIPYVMAQDYPDFEVIVINDGSWDDTEEALKELVRKYPGMRTIQIREDEYYSHGKKLAVTVGIKGAKSEYLVFTDADCRPVSAQWLRCMARNFDQEHDVVLGYGAYEKGKGFLNRLIRFDTFTIALMYLSYAIRRMPYMGVGRNLAYKRSLFFKNKGFATHYYIDSGDDDLFVNEAARGKNTCVETAPESFTVSDPKTSMKEWFRQKRRHAGTFRRYRFASRWKLAWFGLSQYLFFLTFLPLLILWYFPVVIIPIFALRMLIQALVLWKAMTRLGEKDLFVIYPFLEASLMLLYPIIALRRHRPKTNKWKS